MIDKIVHMESTLVELIKYFEKYSSEINAHGEADNLASFALYLHGQLDISGRAIQLLS